MRVLICLTYYRPHISGLTIYAERLAKGLARRGHEVTVLTSRFHPRLPPREMCDDVDVVRVPVAAKISKGALMPLFPLYARQHLRRCDVVNVHMPQLESALLCGLAWWQRKPTVITYQCDLSLPPGLLNLAVQRFLVPLDDVAARLADRIVVMTEDYADHSPYLRRHRRKLAFVPPIVELPAPDERLREQLLDRYDLRGRVCVGFAARFAAEKGVEHLLAALPRVVAELPEACIAFTGAYKDTVGEEDYHAVLRPLLDQHRDRIRFLDLLGPAELASFFSLCQVLAVTSLNSTESFGLVQAEAMLSGTPVVTSDLPGVRQAVRWTGMGEVVPPGNPSALAAAIVRVVRERARYVRPRAEVEQFFGVDRPVREYERLFEELIAQRR